MPFVKLDCGILDSTIWSDSDARDVFLTALLMAVPREFTEPMPQIEVSSLELTGWAVPPGWYGFVEAAGSGIVRRSGVEHGAGVAALNRLGSPEQDSRTPDHDGRRCVRVDGGYVILNFIKYRERDHSAAERSRRYRDKQRHAVISERHGVAARNVTQAEAEAEADAKTTTSRPADVTDDPQFGVVWAAYPKRAGSNPKRAAWRCWHARIKDKIAPAVILAGVQRYAAYCRATGKWGTEYVMQATRFFGPNAEYTEAWKVPPAEPQYKGHGGERGRAVETVRAVPDPRNKMMKLAEIMREQGLTPPATQENTP